MIRSLTEQVVRVAILASLTVAVVEAQSGAGSDFTGVGAAGASFGASSAPLGLPSGALAGPLTSAGSAGLSGVATTFGNPGAGGLSISNPAGGTVTVSPSTARAIAAVLTGGGASAAQSLQGILVGEGVSAGAATALANALAALGSNPSLGNLAAAVSAFNASVDAGPSSPGPAMLAVRFALASASR